MKWRKLFKTFPLQIFLVALILRLVPVLATQSMGIGLDDKFQYDMLARSIVAGNGYRWYAQGDLPLIQPYLKLDLTSVNYDPRGVLTSFRPPLYPTFLALLYLLTGSGGNRFFVTRLFQAVLAASLAPLTYVLARRIFKNSTKTAIIAAWVVALYPMLVIYPLSLATENLFIVLVLTLTLVLLKAADSLLVKGKTEYESDGLSNPSRQRFWKSLFRSRWFILAGINLGLAALTRSVSLGLVGLVVLWIWFVLHEWKMAVLLIVTVALVTLPWMVRNSRLNQRLTGIESALGYDLYVGYYPQGSGTFQYPQSLNLLSIVDDGQRDTIGREKAIEFIQADPGRFPYLIIRRAGYFFGLERRALTYFYSNNFFGYIPTSLLLSVASIVCLPFVIITSLSAFGLALTSWRKETLLVALLIIGYLTPHLFIIAEDRFHLTLVPFLAILAAFFWIEGRWSALKARWKTHYGKIAICLASIAVLFLVTNWGLELWRDAGKLALLLGPYGNQTYFSY